MKTFRAAAFGAAALLAFAQIAQAAPVKWEVADGGNGHSYEVVSVLTGSISWTAAKADADSKGGYLATLTSSVENDFVFDLIDDPAFWQDNGGVNFGPWFGLSRDPLAAAPADGWVWENGEGVLGFENWRVGEPNGDGNYAHFLAFNDGVPRVDMWNDQPDNSAFVKAYVIEYDPTPVPVPAALPLLIGGIGALGFLRRRKTC